ncbi:MAG: hypothetical protein Q9226_005214 [Calogaya cf. arnoldii]
MASRSPDKKRLVSRPLSPDHKRRKSSADGQDIPEKNVSSRSDSSSLGSAWLAHRKRIREGKRPERDSSEGESIGAGKGPERCLKKVETPEERPSGDKSDRPSPEEGSTGDDSGRPPSEVSSGDSSWFRHLGLLDNMENAFDDVPTPLDHIEDERSSLVPEPLSLSGRAKSRGEADRRGIYQYNHNVQLHAPVNAGAGPRRRKFSFETEEHESSFSRSSCPSPTPSFRLANEFPGSHPSPKQEMHPPLDAPIMRGRVSELIEPVEPSTIEARDVSPWSKIHPDWRHSKMVTAGVITGSMGLERARRSSQGSEAEENRSSASMKVRSSSVSSIATNVTVGCTSEIAEDLKEALDTDISTCDVVAVKGMIPTPLWEHNIGQLNNDNNACAGTDEALTEALLIDPSLQAGVYHGELQITSDAREPTSSLERESLPLSPGTSIAGERIARRPKSPSEALSEALSVDPSLQAGVYGRELRITPNTPEPTLPPERQSCPRTDQTSNNDAWTGKQLVVGMSKRVHRMTADKQKENRRNVLTSSSMADLVNAGPSGGLSTGSEADERMAAQRTVPRNEETRTIVRMEKIFQGRRDQRTGEGRALIEKESSRQSLRQSLRQSSRWTKVVPRDAGDQEEIYVRKVINGEDWDTICRVSFLLSYMLTYKSNTQPVVGLSEAD